MALLSSIPRNIKNKIKLYQPPTTTYNLGELVREVCLQPKTTEYAYKKVVQNLNFDIEAKSKWENIVGFKHTNAYLST